MLDLGHYGKGIAKGMGVTVKHLLKHPVTTQYPEQRLVPSRRTRGNELIWQEDQCSGCTTCAKTCPQGVIRIKTTGTGSEQAPCSVACPSHINIPLYLRYIAEGKPEEALAVIREKIPFPSVCGKVCFHPCEKQCQRTQIDSPVSIRVLKGFAASHDTGIWRTRAKIKPSTGKKVAVVGAGPSGLTAAYYLAKLGHKVTVFEALPEPGGMMRVGIPDYRLPKDTLRKEIDEIRAVGVEIRTNSKVENLDELFSQGYNAIYIAIGAHSGMPLGVDGENTPGVLDSATFLRESALGRPVKIGKRVAVVGGGNVATDAARVSLRYGAAEVIMLYRRTRAEMPANPEEVIAAIDEGVKIEFLVTPQKVTSANGELKLECIRMQLGERDESGRRRPEPIKGSEFSCSYDTIISAVGQRVNVPKGFNVKVAKNGILEADEKTLATSREGVFAGGDAQLGPASVIEAIAAGRQGAVSIDKYLGGKGIIDETLAAPASKEPPLSRTDKNIHRVHPSEVEVRERVKNFVEIELPLTSDVAVKEANRCLKCDLAYSVEKIEADMGYCIFCGLCVEACPRDALFLDYNFEKAVYKRQDLLLDKEKMLFEEGSKKVQSGFCRPRFEEKLPIQTLLQDRDKP